MGKNKLPFFQMYPKDWLVDLAEHSLEIEGAWIRICCYLWEAEDRGKLSKRLSQWGRILGVSAEKAFEILSYIQAEKIGNISPDLSSCNDDLTIEPNTVVTVISRRIYKEEKEREKNRLRRRKHYQKSKCNGDVTDGVTDAEQKTDKNLTPPSYHISDCTSTSSYEDVSRRDKPDRSGMPSKRKGESSDDFHARYMTWAGETLRGMLQQNRDQWAAAYPAVGLDQDVAAALVWLQSNPTKRKKDLASFITRWLGRTQENGGNRLKTVRRARSPAQPTFEDRAEMIYKTVCDFEGDDGQQGSNHQGVVETGQRVYGAETGPENGNRSAARIYTHPAALPGPGPGGRRGYGD